jgi:hypothetical protein
MINNIVKFMINNIELCFALDLLIITGVCYFFKVNCFISLLLVIVYCLCVHTKYKHLLFKR